MSSGWDGKSFEIEDAKEDMGHTVIVREHSIPLADAEGSNGGQQPPGSTPSVSWRPMYMMTIFCLTGCLLFADQNLMAPNLTAIGNDFGFTPEQRDKLLGGAIAAVFYMVGAPAALLFGWLCDRVDRRKLLFVAVVLGEAPAVLTLLVTRYWQLFLLRVLTGVSLGGALPVIFSLMSDLTSHGTRATAAAIIQVAVGAGLAIGQGIAGFVGPRLGWRAPFAIVAAPTTVLALLMLLTTRDPPRGRTEVALAEQFESGESFAYEEHLDWKKVRRLLSTPTNLACIGQGVFGCIPWGMLLTFLNDYLAQEKGLGVQAATMVLLFIGVGGAIGVLGGGLLGQWIYNRYEPAMPLYIGASTMLGCLPMAWVLNADVRAHYGLSIFMALCVGMASSAIGPNARAMVLNVNEPESRGLALALQTMLDDLGKGLGPVIVAALIGGLGRSKALNVAALFWLPCGLVVLTAAFTLVRDEDAVQERLRRVVENCVNQAGERERLRPDGALDSDRH